MGRGVGWGEEVWGEGGGGEKSARADFVVTRIKALERKEGDSGFVLSPTRDCSLSTTGSLSCSLLAAQSNDLR